MKKSKPKIFPVGRPPIGLVKKAISICLDPEIIKKLDLEARKAEMSKSAFIAMLIEEK